MDCAAGRKHDLPQSTFHSSPQTSKLELQSAMELQENPTPISKLCDTLTGTVLGEPSQTSQQNVVPIFMNTPHKSLQRSSLKTLCLSPKNKSVHSLGQTPHSGIHDKLQQFLKETPSHSPAETSLQYSVHSLYSPLAVPLEDVNLTPRRNPRRSCVDQLSVSRFKSEEVNELEKHSILNNEVWKDNSSLSTIPISVCKNDVLVPFDTSMDVECVSPAFQEKEPLLFQDKSDKATVYAKNSACTNQREKNVESEVLKFVPSFLQNNKLTITSEPKLSRKSDIFGASVRKLSFSAKKTHKRKSVVVEYDPDNDIFTHGLMPLQFNVDSLKHDIGKYLDNSDSPSPNLQRSSSCSTFGSNFQKESTTSHVSPLSSKRRQSKRSSPQASKPTLKRTTSAPDLLITEPLSSKSDFKVAPEGTLQAFLRARDIIKNIKQRAKNSCDVPTQLVEPTSTVKPTVTIDNVSAYKNDVSQHQGSVQNSGMAEELRNENADQSFGVEDNNTFLDLPPTQPFESFILGDITAFVEVISNNEDISAGVKKELIKLGATVVPSFTKGVPVTHVVFNDGHISTYKKAKKRNIPLVSVLWIEECRKAGVRVNESLFPPSQIERYESPSIVKQLKKRRIMHFSSTEKPKSSPRRKKEVHKNGTMSPSTEIPINNITKRKSSRVPKWVEEVAGGNGVVGFLVGRAGINRNEFQDLINRPPTPDSDIEPDQNSPLAVRLLRKMAKNADNNFNCDRTPKRDVSHTVNSSIQNSLFKKLKETTEMEKESPVENTAERDKSISADGGNHISCVDSSDVMNVTHKRRVPKRKLLSPVEKTAVVATDVVTTDGEDAQKTVIENPHNSTPKRLCDKNVGKTRKPTSGEETSQTAAFSKMECNARAVDAVNEQQLDSVDPIRRSRRSSLYFKKKEKPSLSNNLQKPALVCTLLHTTNLDMDLIVSIVDKLGTFVVDKTVTVSTTHIVTGSPKRTMKVLKGMARGCWIVSHSWVLKSLEAGKWLDEEEFEMTAFSPAVQKYRLEKLSFGGIFKPDIFSSCGPIFVSSNTTSPARGDLVELILLCGGTIASRIGKAEIVVGKKAGIVCVAPLWVLDSVQYYCCKPLDIYICT